MGAPAHVMLRLQVRSGELETDGQWVYAWIGPAGVVYVGATTLHPATRTWLHLHDEKPEVGRMRARYPELANEELDVVAVALADDVDRQQVRHSARPAARRAGLAGAEPRLRPAARGGSDSRDRAIRRHRRRARLMMLP